MKIKDNVNKNPSRNLQLSESTKRSIKLIEIYRSKYFVIFFILTFKYQPMKLQTCFITVKMKQIPCRKSKGSYYFRKKLDNHFNPSNRNVQWYEINCKVLGQFLNLSYITSPTRILNILNGKISILAFYISLYENWESGFFDFHSNVHPPSLINIQG